MLPAESIADALKGLNKYPYLYFFLTTLVLNVLRLHSTLCLFCNFFQKFQVKQDYFRSVDNLNM